MIRKFFSTFNQAKNNMKSVEGLFVYGTLRPDIEANYSKDFLDKYNPKWIKANVSHAKLFLNKTLNYSLLFIEKEKYKESDTVLGYILRCGNHEGLLHELIFEKSKNAPGLTVKNDLFFSEDENRFYYCDYFFHPDENNVELGTGDYKEYIAKKNRL